MYGGKVIRFLRSDWWKAERKNTKPLRLNETLWIVPHPDQARYWKSRYPKKTILCIGNRMAFGTGRHETTAMCLHAMLWLMNQFQHALSKTTCIDVGTGSGILVLAARALGFEEGIGIDHDATAIRIARQHAQENKIKARFILAEATRSPVRKKADLIFANLYSEVLVRAADQLIQMAKPGGFLILSGITKNQEPEIISAYAQLRWIRKFHQRNWACLVARRLQGSY
jgi:ribosomal protein L11 methyltransferase